MQGAVLSHCEQAPYKLEKQSVLCKKTNFFFFVIPVQIAGTHAAIELRICSVKPRDTQSKNGALRAMGTQYFLNEGIRPCLEIN